MGGISIWQLAIIVIVVAVLFGGKRLRNLGGDLGASLKGFKKAMKEEEPSTLEHQSSEKTEKPAAERSEAHKDNS